MTESVYPTVTSRSSTEIAGRTELVLAQSLRNLRLFYTVLRVNSDIFKNNNTSFWNLVPNSELCRFFCLFATSRRSWLVLST